MEKTKRIASGLVILVLLLAGILTLALPQRTYSPQENRVLHTHPVPGAQAILDGSFQTDLSDSLSDQFPLRTQWMATATRLKLFLGRRDISDTYIGKDHHYFEKVLDSHIPQDRFVSNLQEVEALTGLLPDTQVTLMLIPSAGNILADKLPDHARLYDAPALYQLAGKTLKNVHLVDPSSALLAASEEPIYYRTDHHWSCRGAYTAYQVLMGSSAGYGEYRAQTVSRDFYGTLHSRTLDPASLPDTIELPEISKDIRVEADGEEIPFYQKEYLAEKNQYQVYLGGDHGKVTITGGSGSGTLVIIKDSFANCMVPFLTADYETIILVDLRYYPGSVRQLLTQLQPEGLLIMGELSKFAQDRNLVKLAL